MYRKPLELNLFDLTEWQKETWSLYASDFRRISGTVRLWARVGEAHYKVTSSLDGNKYEGPSASLAIDCFNGLR